ncbi:MAG TPA: glycerol-3-phosphate 1-O-acyltransferase [Solirubrobacteraceae bacterium]|nr:glycerol-3-phosphate 1-O-acyltransferase [Solirubrobacteraceae bacterium]
MTGAAVVDQASERASAAWPAPPGADALVLAFASTPAERAVLEDWLRPVRSEGAHVEVLDASEDELERALGRARADPWLVPVGVAWLPRERDGVRTWRPSDLLTLSDPRHPGARQQARILRHEPDRCRVVAAEPARLSELRSRFQGARSEEGFPAFVARQARLALERAERSVLGKQYKVPRLVAEEIEASARFNGLVAALAAELGRPQTEVAAEASAHLREMVASHSRLAIDAWEQFGRWMSRAYEVEVDPVAVEELRRLSASKPLVFLPSHRSYLDPVILRSALHHEGFAPNHVLGGLNVSFWPIGPVARRSGAVFIRRSIRDDPVYKLVLREYIGYLVRKRFNLEWYMEGGRTRTGKLRPPRYGLLKYLVQAYRAGGIDDILLIPTSIVYDQLYEIGAMAAEEHGAQKTPESLAWLVGYARAQGRGFGKARVGFGEPLSLREALGDEERDHVVERIAIEVSHRINRVTPITETALVALALLGGDDRALTLEEVRATLDPLLEHVHVRHLPMLGDFEIAEPEGVRAALDSLCLHGVARAYTGGSEPVWSISPERHLEAAFYRNSIIHFFLNRAIAELVLVYVDEKRPPDPVEAGWREALRVRDLLKFEFFFAPTQEFESELRTELGLLDPDWELRVGDPGAAWTALTETRLRLAPLLLSSFLEAYLVVAERLAQRDPGEVIDEKQFAAECLGVAHQYRLQQRIHSTESISRELFGTALRLAGNRGLLEPGGDELAARRAAFADEVRTLVARLQRIRSI